MLSSKTEIVIYWCCFWWNNAFLQNQTFQNYSFQIFEDIVQKFHFLVDNNIAITSDSAEYQSLSDDDDDSAEENEAEITEGVEVEDKIEVKSALGAVDQEAQVKKGQTISDFLFLVFCIWNLLTTTLSDWSSNEIFKKSRFPVFLFAAAIATSHPTKIGVKFLNTP